MRSFTVVFSPWRAVLFMLCSDAIWYGCVRASRPWWLRDSTPTVVADKASFVTLSSLLLFTLGNYSSVLNTHPRAFLMAGSAALGILVFEWIGALPYMHNGLHTVSEWSFEARLVYGGAFVASALSLCKLVGDAHRAGVVREWLFGLGVLGCVVLGALAYTLLDARGRTTLHVHHWWYAYALAFFARFDSIFSVAFAGVLTGIYLEGLAMSDNLFVIDTRPPLR